MMRIKNAFNQTVDDFKKKIDSVVKEIVEDQKVTSKKLEKNKEDYE